MRDDFWIASSRFPPRCACGPRKDGKNAHRHVFAVLPSEKAETPPVGEANLLDSR
jgi:hypothetical protein